MDRRATTVSEHATGSTLAGIPMDSNPQGMNSSPFMNAILSVRSNLLGPQNIAAQRQTPPAPQPKIYGNPLDASNLGRPLTDDQIASIIFNETRSLSGPGINDARYNNAMVILHNNLNLRTLPKMAPARATVPSAEQAAYDSILSTVRRARTDFLNGINPTNRATNFNYRENNSASPFLNMPLRTQIGPLSNSFPTNDLPASGIYANTYGRSSGNP